MTAENLYEKFSTFLLSVTKRMGQHMNLPLSEDSCVVWVVIMSEKLNHKYEQWARIFKMSHSFKITAKTVESFRVRQSTECFR